MFIDWARHGQNVANLTETFSYRVVDCDLSELGREQAQSLGRLLREREPGEPSLLVCSPLARVRQTAQIVAEHLSQRAGRLAGR